jgi:Transport and Golgi organisation 2
MCTVSFTPRRSGYALAMNRDEKRARIVGLPPELFRIEGRSVLNPAEPDGGTWISLNDAGATFALINWYAIARRVEAGAVSRGEVVRRVRPAETLARARAQLELLPLERLNPFRLIGVFPGERLVREWQWNLETFTEVAHRWADGIWISSGFDEATAQAVREKTFRRARQQVSAGSLDWLSRLHRSHGPESGPFSICMHRADAASVSYTEVCVRGKHGVMRYHAGTPCSAPPISIHQVELAS